MRTMLRTLALLLALAPHSVSAASVAFPTNTTNRTVVGDLVEIREPVAGDLVVAAARVRILAPVAGDVLIAGGNIDLEGDVEGDVRIAAGQVQLRSVIGGEALIAAGEVTLGPTAAVGADLRVTAASFFHQGRIEQDGYISVGAYEFDGRIGGSAQVETGELMLGTSASVAGDFSYTATRPMDEQLREKVRGTTTYTRPAATSASTVFEDIVAEVNPFWILGLALLGMLLAWLFPTLATEALDSVRIHPLRTYIAGALTAISIFAILLAFLTIIGIPLALLFLAVWMMLILSTKLVVALVATEWLAARFQRKVSAVARFLGLLVMLLALDTIGALPVIHIAVWLVVYPLALGATTLALPRLVTIHGRRAPHPEH